MEAEWVGFAQLEVSVKGDRASSQKQVLQVAMRHSPLGWLEEDVCCAWLYLWLHTMAEDETSLVAEVIDSHKETLLKQSEREGPA